MMDRDQYQKLVNDPRRTREGIEQMRRNALDKGEIELAHIAKIALDERFPGWDRPKRKASGATPTIASFRDKQESFSTAKDAYVWLMNHFVRDRPEILESEDWQAEFVSKGQAVHYFARDRKSLFHRSPHLADDPNFYTRLDKGWFADLNLSNEQKFKILCRFAAVAEYRFEKDWNWEVQGEKKKDIDRLLREF